MKRLGLLAWVCVAACSKQAPPAPPVGPEADAAPAPVGDARSAETSPEEATPAQTEDTAQGPDTGPAPVGDACERGDKAGCAELAQRRIARYEAIQNTIYSVEDPAELPVFANPFPLAERACELGDAWSCAFLADAARGVACGPGWEESAGDAAKAKAYEAKARPLLEALCEGTGPACDRLIEAARAGCGGPVDLERARPLVLRKVEGKAAACRGGDPEACLRLSGDCRAYGALAEGEAGAQEGPAAPVEALSPKAITASTVLPPWRGYRFGAEQVGDGALDTSWQPLDKKRGGVGQWIELDLGGDFVVSGLRIGNGLQRKDAMGDLFAMNNRARRVLVGFDGGPGEHVELGADERGLVERRFAGRVTRRVLVTVEAIHRGSKWNDLAISELVVLGKPARVSAGGPICGAPAAHFKLGCERGELEACRRWWDVSAGAEQEAATGRIVALATEACRVAPAGGAGLALCWEAAKGTGDPAAATALLEHGCKGGDDLACEGFGCPALSAEEPGRFSGAAEAKPEVCREGCAKGATGTCLGLVGGSVFGLEGVADWPKVEAMARSMAARCDDKDDCEKAGLAAQPEPRTTPEMPDAVRHFEAFAYLVRACELGAVEACEAAAWSLEELSGPAAEAVKLRKRGCELGDAFACAGVGEEDARAKGLALLVPRCEAGELTACNVARSLSRGDDISKIETKIAALDKAACEAGEVARCQDQELRLARAGALCASKGECAVMCETAEQLTGGELVRGLSAEQLEKVQKLVEVMTADQIAERCFDVILADPCSCGCC